MNEWSDPELRPGLSRIDRGYGFIMPIIFALIFLLISGCSTLRTARLYPADDKTAPTGVIEAIFNAGGAGNGTVEMHAPDGEMFKGEYSIVRDGSVGFGNIFGAVFSPAASVNYSSNGMSYTSEGKSQGMVFALGGKGTRMECEFLNDNWSGHGYGACKTSTGLLYKLAY